VTPQAFVAQAATTPDTHDTLTTACGRGPGIACRLVWDVSHSGSSARLTAVYLAGPVDVALRIAFVILLALVIRSIVHRLINRITTRAAAVSGPLLPDRLRRGSAAAATQPATMSAVEATQVLVHERRHQRARALGSILRNAASVTILGIAGITILGDLGVNLAPVLASAGVLGVAIGFGAQSLVGDFLAGIFMLLEDQYGVGDVINVGDASTGLVATGTVEAVSLRVTRLRDINGIVWHVRNGTIMRIGNDSQGWARAVIDFPIPYDQDISRARQVMRQTASALWNEPRWREVILEEPEVWGVQDLVWGAQDQSGNAVVMRLAVKTTPLEQWAVARELRERLKLALDAEGINATTETPPVSPAASAPAPPPDKNPTPP